MTRGPHIPQPDPHYAAAPGKGLLSALLVFFLATTLSLSWQLDEYEMSGATQDAITTMQLEQRVEDVARALCHSERGPGSTHRWDQDGSLVCMHPLDRRALSAGL